MSKPVVALPLIIFVVAVFVFVPICLVRFEKSYSEFSVKYATEQALNSYKENHFDEAAMVLERLAISHKLDEEQRSLLNNIYLARAEQRANNLDYNNAIGDLDKISPQFSKSILVSLKKHEYFELLTKQQNRTRASVAVAKAHLKTAAHSTSLKTPTVCTEPSLSTPVALKTVLSSNKSTPASKSVASTTALSSNTSPAKLTADYSSPTLSLTGSPTAKAPFSSTATVPAFPPTTTNAPMMASSPTLIQSSPEMPHSQSLPAKVPKTSKSIKYAENDLVRYNELLAGYFSQDRKTSSALAGPPSLKEWIDLGKPSF